MIECFPEALLEDPHDIPEVIELLRPHHARVSYDAPVTTAAALDETAIRCGAVNVKPSRIGGLEELFKVYARCGADGLPMYGGGMGELGVARGQIQLLASLFHPDTFNDVAPSAFNLPEPPPGIPPARSCRRRRSPAFAGSEGPPGPERGQEFLRKPGSRDTRASGMPAPTASVVNEAMPKASRSSRAPDLLHRPGAERRAQPRRIARRS